MTANPDSLFLSAAAAIAEVGRDLYGRGWLPATSGNLSVRLDADSCAVTVSSRHKGRLAVADVMRVDLAGRALSPGRPSAETLLHTALYGRSEAIGAVLHTHGPASTVVGLRHPGRTELVVEGYELLKAFAGIETHATRLAFPIFDNTQDIAALAGEVGARLDRAPPPCYGYLIRGHGTYVWGRDLDEAGRHLEALEYLAACELALAGPGAVPFHR
jgi:methylthioribulose-1-phosphate dehydratase